MPNRRTPPIPIPLPLRGLDTSSTLAAQPPGTSPDLLNVRGYEQRERFGLGKRDGLATIVSDRFGLPGGNRRVNGIGVLTQAQGAPALANSAQIAVSEDWSTFSTADPFNQGSGANSSFYDQRVIQSTRTEQAQQCSIDASNNLLMDVRGGASPGLNLLAINYFTTNDITVTIEATATATDTSDDLTVAGEPNGIGPAIRCDNTMRNGVFAQLRTVGTEQVQLNIIEFSGTTETVLQTGTTHTLSGSGTPTSFTIRLQNTSGDTVQATLTWSSESISETISGTTSTSSSSFRGGIVVQEGNGTRQNYRTCTALSYTRLVPPSPTAISTVNPATDGGANYFLPTSWKGVEFDGASYTITADNPTSSTDPNWPAVENSTNQITARSITNSVETLMYYACYTGTQAVQYGIECTLDSSHTDDFDCASACFRVSDDLQDALIVALRTPAESGTSFREISQAFCYALIDGTLTYLGMEPLSDLYGPGLRDNGTYTVTDDGTTVRIYVNGIAMASFNPGDLANWTQAIEDALEGNTGVGFTGGARNAAATDGDFGTVRVVPGESGGETLSVSNFKPLILVMTENYNQVIDAGAGTVSNVVGDGFMNALPEVASFNLKFYGVDGDDAYIIDPIALTSTDWATEVTSSGSGSLPANCELVALYRGRIVLARQNTDASAWFMSRTFNPLDWDFNAEPLSTAPYAGTNAEVGRPGDAVTALIPFADDYMILGGTTTINRMEGDPGYGGSVQLLTNETGIVGPRAWAFDDLGNLYFIGAGGLYRLMRGENQPQNLSRPRVSKYLDDIDYGANLIQLAFDGFRQEIHIFVTPTEDIGSAYAIVYDPKSDSFWRDDYPDNFGPTALGNLRGDTAQLRRFAFGGATGFMYWHREGTTADGIQAIRAFCRFAPIALDDGLQESILTEFRVHGDAGNSPVSWYWLNAQTEDALSDLFYLDETTNTGTLFSDGLSFQQSIRTRIRNGALQFVLGTNDTTASWRIERIQAFVGSVGNRRP